MRRKPALALLGLIALAAGACQVAEPPTDAPLPPGVAVNLAPRIASRPAGGDPALVAGMPEVRVLATWTTPLLDQPDGHAIDPGGVALSGNGLSLAVLGGAVTSGGQAWLRAFALPNQQSGPAAYFGWIPADPNGTGSGSIGAPTTCPSGDASLVDLGRLDPFTRARCLGATTFDVEGYVSWMALPVWYDVEPSWLGRPQDGLSFPSFSLQAGPTIYAYSDDPTSLDLQLPPGLEPPPFGLKVSVRAHAADPESASCRRTSDPALGLPTEAADDSVLWCSTRLVVEGWTPLLGPEGRPIDPRAPQLHRHPSTGGNHSCAGVGMPPLTFHVDPNALDPVWLETAGSSWHVIASFDPSFRAVYTPELVVLDKAGQVIARDGAPLDPDSTLAGHAICPMGQIVSIDD